MSTLTQTRIAIDCDVPMPMSDGIVLAADVYRPAAAGPFPTILLRTPYDKRTTVAAAATAFGFDLLAAVRAGYVVVVQDARGTFASDGVFRAFVDEAADGAISTAWISAQDWSDGTVGMAGGSYVGATQLLAATSTPPALKAIAPVLTASEYHEGWTYQGGAFQLGFALMWASFLASFELRRREAQGEDVTDQKCAIERVLAEPWGAYGRLPLVDLPRESDSLRMYRGWLERPNRDEFWRAAAVNEAYGSIDVPALHIAGWNDIFLKGSLENFIGLRSGAATSHARESQHLVVTPWGHATPTEVVGDLWYGAEANPAALALPLMLLEFFETFLKRGPAVERAPVRLFVMGRNTWRDEDSWPLARAVDTRFFLRTGGRLTRDAPGEEPADVLAYDPRDPVPTVGGNTILPGDGYFMGPRDRRAVEMRTDVLVFTSDVLREDLEVTGPLKARLHVATSVRDTDFTATLVDVYPDSRAIGIADGILRLRYRDGLEKQVLAVPGEIYEIEVDLDATSNVFLAGHRIRMEVSSSNFPRFDRNPNHGGVIAEATEQDFVVARQHVFHDAAHPSFIDLPVVPG